MEETAIKQSWPAHPRPCITSHSRTAPNSDRHARGSGSSHGDSWSLVASSVSGLLASNVKADPERGQLSPRTAHRVGLPRSRFNRFDLGLGL